MRYNYSYRNDKLNPLRYVILSLALLSDFVNIFMIFSAVFNPIIIVYVLLVFIVFLGARIATIYMNYSIEYSYYKKEFRVEKIYYREPHLFVSFNKDEIKRIYQYDGTEINAISVYSKTCLYPMYVIELSNDKRYILCLDETMYAALTCEDKYDLFR